MGKQLGIGTDDLVRTSLPTEATDPTWYSAELVVAARRMSEVYLRLYLFENKLRDLVETVLREARGDGWFNDCVTEPMRKEAARRKSEDGSARFHRARGDDLVDYLSVPDFAKIIEDNWKEFEDLLYRKSWASGKLEELRLTRNATAHMGLVSDDDLQRLDILLRDWNRQLG